MNFTWAKCDVCSNYIKDISRLVAYRLRHDGDGPYYLERVDLRGQDPWSGVRVVCHDCIDFFRLKEVGP